MKRIKLFIIKLIVNSYFRKKLSSHFLLYLLIIVIFLVISLIIFYLNNIEQLNEGTIVPDFIREKFESFLIEIGIFSFVVYLIELIFSIIVYNKHEFLIDSSSIFDMNDANKHKDLLKRRSELYIIKNCNSLSLIFKLYVGFSVFMLMINNLNIDSIDFENSTYFSMIILCLLFDFVIWFLQKKYKI